jgi:outer membrane protein
MIRVLVISFSAMKNTVLTALSIALAAAAFGWSLTHKPPKLAYAETSVLLAEFTEAIQARKEFDAAQNVWNDSLKTLNDSLTAAIERAKASFETAKPVQKDSIQKVLNARNADLQAYAAAVKQQAAAKDGELMDPVVKKVNSFLDLWGKQHGYDLIFGTMSGGNVLQANPAFNVTAAVLKDLNAQYKSVPKP